MIRKLLILVALPAIVVAHKPKEMTWQTGKVLDAQVARATYVDGSSTTSTTVSGPNSQTTNSNTNDFHTAEKTAHLAIVSDQFLYYVDDTMLKGGRLGTAAVHAIANKHHGCHVIVGDPVRFAQDRGDLYVIDADGKQCRMEIVRQERLKEQTPKQ